MLYIVATPIGNLGDITLRALETLKKVDYILCEDTRNTGLMLANLGINNQAKLMSFYDEVEEQKIPEIIRLLEAGKEIALVTDAGTPIVSDPGYRLIKKCHQLLLEVTSIPGPSAVVNALVLSGLPAGRFCFLGFLPKKSGEKKKILENYKNVDGAKIIYESPFRLKRLLEEINEVCGEKTQVVVCREMTKKFEEIISGNVTEVISKLALKEIKGEITLLFY